MITQLTSPLHSNDAIVVAPIRVTRLFVFLPLEATIIFLSARILGQRSRPVTTLSKCAAVHGLGTVDLKYYTSGTNKLNALLYVITGLDIRAKTVIIFLLFKRVLRIVSVNLFIQFCDINI